MEKRKVYSTYMVFVIGLIIFGSNGIVSSFIGLSSRDIVFWRTLLGVVSLFLIFLLTGNRFTFYKYRKEFFFTALSGIAMGTCWLFLFEAYVRIGVGLSSLLYYCGPIIVMALSPLLFKEKLHSVKLIGFAIVLVGIVLVNGNVFLEGNSFVGLACGAVTAFLYAALVISSKFVLHIQGLEKSLLQVLFSFLTVLLYLLLKGDVPTAFPMDYWLPVLVIGIFNTGLGCYCYFTPIGKLPVQTVAVCGYLEPLSAVILSAVILGESMTLIQVLGVALIIGGAVFCELVKPKCPKCDCDPMESIKEG